MGTNTRLSSIIEINKFSGLLKLLRVTAYVIKFINTIKKKIEDQKIDNENKLKNNLTNKRSETEELIINGDDIQNAKLLWVKTLQHNMVIDKPFNNWKVQLGLFLDNNNVWR